MIKFYENQITCYITIKIPLCPVVLKSLSLVRIFATLYTVPCQATLSIGILQARILEWVARPSSRGGAHAIQWVLIYFMYKTV